MKKLVKRKNILKKGIVIAILLLFIGAGVLPSISSLPSVKSVEKQKTQSATPTPPGIWYVWKFGDNSLGNSWDKAFNTIQQGIDAASPGETIFVGSYGGIYDENVVVNKDQLILKGVEKNLLGFIWLGPVIIDGNGNGDVVNIIANDVTFHNFTIQNSGYDSNDANIQIEGNNCIITNNKIINNDIGVRFNKGIWNNGAGAGGTLISCNTFFGSDIGIDFHNSDGIIISCNKFWDCWCGISCAGITNGIISCNNLSTQEPYFYAISLSFSDGNEISLNSVSATPTGNWNTGIMLDVNCNDNTIFCNTIQNTQYGIAITYNYNLPNVLYDNNLMENNGQKAYDNSVDIENNWDGNYWEGWPGGSYTIPGAAGAVDHFPLSTPCICLDPPTTPAITGPINGIVGWTYDYRFVSQNPRCDCLVYIVDWGDNTPLESSGLVEDSPIKTRLGHSWSQTGTYIIRAKTISLCCGESDWGTLTITIPRNKSINTQFLQFLHNHPNLFPILRLLLQRLGL